MVIVHERALCSAGLTTLGTDGIGKREGAPPMVLLPLTQSHCKAWWGVIRCVGSGLSSLPNNVTTCCDRWLGHMTPMPWVSTAAYRLHLDAAAHMNGNVPDSIEKRMTPRLHISAHAAS